MSYLAVAPKPNVANTVQIADFAELECLRRRDLSVSILDLVRIIGRQDDAPRRGTRSEDSIRERVAEAFAELNARSRHCGHKGRRYPFSVSPEGTLLNIKNQSQLLPSTRDLYVFLLLATRMDMRSERDQAGIDATQLFEQLCSFAAIRFWGGPSDDVRGVVFGTGRLTLDRDDSEDLQDKEFTNRVNQLCEHLKEGIRFNAHPDHRITAKDGKLDIVVWRRFADAREGQLIGFGQCKTGTSWERDLTKLSPEGFCKKWMLKSPAVTPIRLYFVADRVVVNFYDRSTDAGIIFDRCRLMELTDELPRDIMKPIRVWVKAAMKFHKLAIR